MKKTQRTIWVDLLRVIAICLMMLYHLCGKGMWWATTEQYSTSFFSAEYRTLIFFHMLSRVCIPVILMISGMFMLDPEKELSIKKLFGHNILRIFLSLFFWNALYALYYVYKIEETGGGYASAFCNQLFETHYHLHFLYALIGIYIITPILRIFSKSADMREWRYLLFIFLIYVSIIPTLQMFNIPFCKNIFDYILRFSPRYISASSGIGYVAFYMTGYYLKRFGLPERILNLCTVLVLFFGIIEVVGKPYFPEQIAGLGYYDIGTVLGSITVICWMKRILKKIYFREKTKKLIILLSNWSFGAYLVHDFILQFFIDNKSCFLITNPLIGLVIAEVIVVSLSFEVSALLNQIPIVKKNLL